MSEYVNFHYMPLEGKITGKQVLQQTEDAINDLGNKVYNLDIDQSKIDEAVEKSEEAVNTAKAALSAVTTGRSVWFNTVAEMVATDIEAGVTAETKGYYVANDGGNALYLIRQEKSGDVVDGGSLIALDNGNMAELVTDGTVNVKQFGAIGNGTDDDTTVFQNTSSYAQANGFVPFVGVATYKITGNVTGTFNSFGEVTITGGGTVDIINLHEVVSDVSDIRDEVVDETASAKAYSESAATSATNASNSASSASTTATQLMAYLADKETLTAPAVDPTLTISGAAADAKVVGDFRKIAYQSTLCKNLIGTEANVLYPCFIPNGSKITITAQAVETKYNQILCYDSTKTQIDTINISPGITTRTVTISEGDVYYLSLSAKSNADYQVELGESSTSYEPYVPNYKALYNDNIKQMLNDNVITSDVNQFELGEIDNSGNNVTDNQHFRSIDYYTIDDFIEVYASSSPNWYSTVFCYDSSKVFLGKIGGNSHLTKKDAVLSAYPTTAYVRVMFRLATIAELTMADFNSEYIHVLYNFSPAYALREIQKVAYYVHNEIPSYYKTYMESQDAAIRANLAELDRTSDAFVFITDQHITSNAMNSTALIRHIYDKCGVRMIIGNGDLFGSYANKDLAYQIMCAYLQEIKDYNMLDSYYANVGNHEFNDPSASYADRRLTDDQVFQFAVKFEEDRVTFDPITLAFYFDNANSKIRYYFIPCNYGSNIDVNVKKWFVRQLALTPAGYGVVVVSHNALYDKNDPKIHSAFTEIAEALDALKNHTTYEYYGVNDYTNVDAEPIAVFCGHTHFDANCTTAEGIPVICTTCDAYNQELGDLTRTPGTITEQAFDVVAINQTSKTIKLIRIGAGSNRTFSYA